MICSTGLPEFRLRPRRPRRIELSGKGVTLLPLPPLRTGHDGFLSSGSSRYEAPLFSGGADSLDGFNPASLRRMPNFFEERTVFKVVTPTGVKRVRLALDFRMPPDAGVRCFIQLLPDDLPVGCPLAGVGGELVSAVEVMPIFLHRKRQP